MTKPFLKQIFPSAQIMGVNPTSRNSWEHFIGSNPKKMALFLPTSPQVTETPVSGLHTYEQKLLPHLYLSNDLNSTGEDSLPRPRKTTQNFHQRGHLILVDRSGPPPDLSGYSRGVESLNTPQMLRGEKQGVNLPPPLQKINHWLFQGATQCFHSCAKLLSTFHS